MLGNGTKPVAATESSHSKKKKKINKHVYFEQRIAENSTTYEPGGSYRAGSKNERMKPELPTWQKGDTMERLKQHF